jgi:hypothetical protein
MPSESFEAQFRNPPPLRPEPGAATQRSPKRSRCPQNWSKCAKLAGDVARSP